MTCLYNLHYWRGPCIDDKLFQRYCRPFDILLDQLALIHGMQLFFLFLPTWTICQHWKCSRWFQSHLLLPPRLWLPFPPHKEFRKPWWCIYFLLWSQLQFKVLFWLFMSQIYFVFTCRVNVYKYWEENQELTYTLVNMMFAFN